ncbi:MAG: PTS sugar transporter subunit IIA [Spirochaetia bacterium]
MKVANLLVQDMVLPDLESRERDGVLREMVGFLKKSNRIGKEKELYEKLLQREELGSTAIGDGVAIPHCKIKSVKDPLIMLAISRRGVDFHSPDGSPSHIFFVVVSSPENPSLNLQILAAVAHLVRKADALVERMLGSRDAASLVDIIREEENRINE